MCSFSTRFGIESHSIPRFKILASGKSLLTVEVYVENQPLLSLKSISHTLSSLLNALRAYSLWTKVRCQAVQKFPLINSHASLYNLCLGFPEAQKTSCQILPVTSIQQRITYSHLLCGSLLFHQYGSVLRFLFILSEQEMNSLLKRNVSNSVLVII